MQKLFRIALESQEIFVACIWGIIRIGAVKMVGMLLQIQLFFMLNYNKVLFVLVALTAVGLLYLEWKTKKIINEDMKAEEIKVLTGKAEFLRTTFIVAVAFLGLVTKNYAQAFIMLVVEIFVLKINTIRLREELQREKEHTEIKEKMFIYEVKHIAKILRGEL